MFSAPDFATQQEWISVIQNSITRFFFFFSLSHSLSLFFFFLLLTRTLNSLSLSSTSPTYYRLIRLIECIGILICLQCSGAHRSLGCHISKVIRPPLLLFFFFFSFLL